MKNWIVRVIFAVLGVLLTAFCALQEGASAITAAFAIAAGVISFAFITAIAGVIMNDKFKFEWWLFASGMAGTIVSAIVMLILN